MTILPSKLERDLINIDTYEKAFVWSALHLLRASRKFAIDDFKDWVKISHKLFNRENGIIKPLLFIEIKLPYNSELFAISGGDLTTALQPLSLQSVQEGGVYFASNQLDDMQEPVWAETLEEYCLWTAFKLTNRYSLDPNLTWDITISELANQQSYVLIKGELYFSMAIYLNGDSYVDALSSGAAPALSVLNNLSILNNAFVVSN